MKTLGLACLRTCLFWLSLSGLSSWIAAVPQSVIFEIPLEPSQVVPPLVGSTADGSATLSLGTTTGILTVVGDYQGLSAPQLGAVLFGPAPAGANGPPVLLLNITGQTSGGFSGSGLLNPQQIADVQAGRFYVSIASVAFPSGALRGQVCERAAARARAAFPNPDSYQASPPDFGGTLSLSVDLSTTGHSSALLLAFDTAIDVPLPGGQRLLCFDLGGNGELFSGSGLGPISGPLATLDVPVPANLAYCNTRISSQALHFGGVVPFALSNAQDLTLGY